jgi:hypothetical protein
MAQPPVFRAELLFTPAHILSVPFPACCVPEITLGAEFQKAKLANVKIASHIPKITKSTILLVGILAANTASLVNLKTWQSQQQSL